MCGNNHWILRQPGQVNKIDPWPGGPKSNFWQPVIASLVIKQTDRSATDSCFSLVGPRQCGILMVITRWLVASVSTPSRTLVISTEAGS